MELSGKQITNFQELYLKHRGVNISRDQALEFGTQLVALIKEVYSPITEEDLNELTK